MQENQLDRCEDNQEVVFVYVLLATQCPFPATGGISLLRILPINRFTS